MMAVAVVFQFLHRIPQLTSYHFVNEMDRFFQFLHRIPHLPTLGLNENMFVFFQFLHRIPPFGLSMLTSYSSPFNSFTGFHLHEIITFFAYSIKLSIPSPDSTLDRLGPRHDALQIVFQFLHRIPREQRAFSDQTGI